METVILVLQRTGYESCLLLAQGGQRYVSKELERDLSALGGRLEAALSPSIPLISLIQYTQHVKALYCGYHFLNSTVAFSGLLGTE